MTVANEDVAVRRNRDVGRRIEFIESRTRNAFLAKRHQDFSVLRQLEHLMAAVVSHPDGSLMINGQLVRADEHAGAPGSKQLARGLELKYQIDVRTRPGAGAPSSSRIAAAVHHPNRPVRTGRHARG